MADSPIERAPFNPGDPFDAMAESFRLQVAEVFLAAGKVAIFRDLPSDRKIEAFMAGTLTGVIGCVFASFQPQVRDELMKVIIDYLPQARHQAEEILDKASAEEPTHG